MTGTLTPKQLKFAQTYVETGNASEAYRQVYDAGKAKEATVNREAKRLLDNPKVATRIAALQAKHSQRHDVTVDSLTDELESARVQAMVWGNQSAAVSATIGKARLHGKLHDKLLIGRLKVRNEIDLSGAQSDE